MKKILLLALILTFGAQICFAQTAITNNATKSNETVDNTELDDYVQSNDPDENIDRYFSEDVTEELETETTSEAASQTTINGYLEYSEMDQEPVQEAIQLEPAETAQVNFSQPKKIGSKSLITEKKPLFTPMQSGLETASMFSTQEYNIKPVNTTYSKKFGQFSFGTTYDSYLDSARASYTTGMFSKYEGKYLALSTIFSKNTRDYNSYSDKIYIVPELKLTKRLSLLDAMSTDVYQINKKNEVVLRYTPHLKKYADDVQFEIGAGQSFHEDDYVNSSVRFSTRFKL